LEVIGTTVTRVSTLRDVSGAFAFLDQTPLRSDIHFEMRTQSWLLLFAFRRA
jgi:hypothetical protein